MILKMAYRDLDHALKKLRAQVSEGIEYAQQDMPRLESPQAIWSYLKARTTYKNDPKGVELFQTLPTLLENNWHGITGAGDCDCFTIALLSTLLANGFTDCGIVLAGRSPLYPVHIWAYVIDKGRFINMDLTCKVMDKTRHYPYTQRIPYKISEKEKAMILQLAENQTHPYLWIPSMGVQVREDYYDHLSEGKFQHTLLSEGFEPEEIAELSSKRQARKAAKQANKLQKKKAKQEIKAMKPKNVRKQQRLDIRQERVQGRNVAKQQRGEARIIKAQQPQAPPAIPEFFSPENEEVIEVVEAEEFVYPEDQQAAPEIVYYEEEQEQPMSEFRLWNLSGNPLVPLSLAFLGGLAFGKIRKSRR